VNKILPRRASAAANHYQLINGGIVPPMIEASY